MNTLLSPLKVKVLLHAHCSLDPIENRHAPAVEEAIDYLVGEDAIKLTNQPGGMVTTDKGRAWVACICNTPPPTLAWADAAGNPIRFE